MILSKLIVTTIILLLLLWGRIFFIALFVRVVMSLELPILYFLAFVLCLGYQKMYVLVGACACVCVCAFIFTFQLGVMSSECVGQA